MAILHKNISAEGDIHNPKWFSGANNGDVAWRNELGVLESTDELVLPAALNFVDGSVAPPTSNNGDIYVLSSGASVNAGWGTVALGDWVKYDGTAWNVITPQKSTLCYNETLDKLFSYSGSTWAEVGGGGGTDVNAVHVNAPSEISGITAKSTPTASDLLIIEDVADGNNKKKITIGDLPSSGGGASIYTASDTIGTGRVATLTNTLRFKDGTFEIQGIGTTGNSLLSLYDGQGTPVKVWDFLDNGNVNITKSESSEGTIITSNRQNMLKVQSSGSNPSFIINSTGTNQNTNMEFERSGAKKWLFGNKGSNDSFRIYNYTAGGSDSPFEIDSANKFNILNSPTTTAGLNIGENTVINANNLTPLLVKSRGNSSMQLEIDSSTTAYSSQVKYSQGGAEKWLAGVDNSQDFRFYDFSTGSTKMAIKSNTINVSIPASDSGLSSGDLYSDSGTVKIKA